MLLLDHVLKEVGFPPHRLGPSYELVRDHGLFELALTMQVAAMLEGLMSKTEGIRVLDDLLGQTGP